MAIYPIRTFGDPVLRTPTRPVEDIGPDLVRLTEDMLETMYEAPGVGLAAPQIGVSRRVIVFDVGDGPRVLINPEILETSGTWEFEEGCLSVPERYWPIERPGWVRVGGLDLDGKEVEHAGDELLGRVLQHEIDHVDGILLIERLPRSLRKQALRELREEALGLRRPG